VRLFSTLCLLFVLLGTGFQVRSIRNDLLGADTTGEVTEVEMSTPARAKFTVRFVTDDDRQCESVVVTDPPHGRRLFRAGDRVAIHHQRTQPCLNVREAGDRFWWGGIIPTLGLLSAASVLSYLAWRRPGRIQRLLQGRQHGPHPSKPGS
jgi:hypothetical protein